MSGAANSNPKLGLRQRFRQLVSYKPSTLGSLTAINTPASSANLAPSVGHGALARPQQHQQQLASFPAIAQPLFAQVLQRLSLEERTTLSPFIQSASADIHDAVKEAVLAAKDKRQRCLDRRWTCTIANRQVVLREEADKVIHWLDRFKSIGDVASNADPIHVGLPWAGIRLLLQAATIDSDQMAALLVGCEAALHMASRLKAYTDFMYQLPTSSPRVHLEETITVLYAHILKFLAQAIKVYQHSTVHRLFSAIWHLAEIVDFEREGNDLANKMERDASNCDRIVSAQDRQALIRVQQDLQQALTELNRIRQLRASIDCLRLKIDLGKIPYAKGAIFNSVHGVHSACHPATRVDLLAQIQQWAERSDAKHIFWLHGAAGAGKSTISWTFAQRLSDRNGPKDADLGASFFFKRGEGDRGSAIRFFPTIIRQLIVKVPGLDVLIAKVIELDPFIFDKALPEQFRELLLRPLQDASWNSTRSSLLLVVVVDALDECESSGDIGTILKLWSQLAQITSIRLRLFLTSRPELPIRLGFSELSTDTYQDVVLQDAVPLHTIEHDLLSYLQDAFRTIRKQHNAFWTSQTALDSDWPGDDVLERLVLMAVPLFIVVATVCRFVGDIEFDPVERLEQVLMPGSTGKMTQMETTYLPVLDHLNAVTRTQAENEVLCREFRIIVGSIICLAEPLSVGDIGVILGKPPASIERRLASLHSVMHVPRDQRTPVRILHLSFAEFLLNDGNRSKRFGVDGTLTHRNLLDCCLRILSGPEGLRENMCNLDSPGHLRHEVDRAVIETHFPRALEYACQYWVYHCQMGMTFIEDAGNVHNFLKSHFLHWLEALSFLGRLTEAVRLLDILRAITSVANSVQISHFIEDARRFVLSNRSIVERAPLQLYSSAIIAAPELSLIRNVCGSIPKWIQRYPPTTATWSLKLQKLEGHTHVVFAVAFSPNDALLASASADWTVRLWAVQTGREVQRLEGHSGSVNIVVFSPDGTLLASGSDDSTVRLWEVQTGRELRRLEGHGEPVMALAFSRYGTSLASGSADNTISLWEAQTEREVQRLDAHDSMVSAVAFSPDGGLLVSGSTDTTICLWNVATGRKIQQFIGHGASVRAVTFSPDGTLVASGSSDWTVRVWNLQTGQQILYLQGHRGSVHTVAFSPNGMLLASGSDDETVRIWEVRTGKKLQRLEGHCDTVKAVAFSPDGASLASGSQDRTARIWEVDTGREMQLLGGHVHHVEQVAFSPDGMLLVSGSRDLETCVFEVYTGRKVQGVDEAGSIGTLRFLDEGQTLVINGVQSNNLQSSPEGGLSKFVARFEVKGEWIQCNNQSLLWLPHEYRGTTALYGSTIAIGAGSGRVCFFELTDPKLISLWTARFQVS